jgi:divalent metal cation (Fe/Co/Zn/Cd) transporter
MYFGPHTVLLTMDAEFRDNLSGSERDAAVQRLKKAIREKHNDINHIFIEAKSLSGKAERHQSGHESP